MTVADVIELARQNGLDADALTLIGQQTNPNVALQVAVSLGLDPAVASNTNIAREAAKGQDRGVPPEGVIVRDPKPGESESRERVEASQDFQRYSAIVAANQAGRQLTDEEVEFAQEFESDADKFQAWLESIGTAEEWNYDWVYNSMGIMPGMLDEDGALLSLLPILTELGVEIDENVDDAAKVGLIKEVLARNPQNPVVRLAVEEWGRENDTRVADRYEAGTLALVEAGHSLARALTITNVAKMNDIDPVELAQIWEGQDATYFSGSVAGLERDLQTGADVTERLARKPIMVAAAAYRQGLEMYDQSRVLAAVHVNDPELARRMRVDPYGLDSGELQRVLDYMGGAEGKEGDPQVSWIVNRLAGGYQTTATVDTEQVRDAVQTLADTWNLTGSEDVAAAIAQEIVGDAVARARASLPNPFGALRDPVSVQDTIQDITASVKKRFRQLPEYQELFGEKRAGESEEEYARRFENQSQRVVGDDNAALVRAGMRSGNINTIYQAALMGPAGESSTRFQEILARNADVFRRLL